MGLALISLPSLYTHIGKVLLYMLRRVITPALSCLHDRLGLITTPESCFVSFHLLSVCLLSCILVCVSFHYCSQSIATHTFCVILLSSFAGKTSEVRHDPCIPLQTDRFVVSVQEHVCSSYTTITLWTASRTAGVVT